MSMNKTLCVGNFQNTKLGLVYITHGSFYLPLYVLCLIVLWRKPLRKKSCYKIMGAIGFMDVTLLIMCGHAAGYWCISGTTFCDSFWHMKIGGAIVNSCWVSYCLLCVALAANRFGHCGKTTTSTCACSVCAKVYIWIGICLLIGCLNMALLLSPYLTFLYNSYLGLFIFDPFSPSQARIGVVKVLIENGFFTVAMISLYTMIIVRLRKLANSQQGHMSATEKSIITQSALICLMATLVAMGYIVAILFFPTNPTTFTIVALLNQLAQGSNPVVYLVFNKTIRHRVAALFSGNTVVEPITTTAAPGPTNASRHMGLVPKPATVAT